MDAYVPTISPANGEIWPAPQQVVSYPIVELGSEMASNSSMGGISGRDFE